MPKRTNSKTVLVNWNITSSCPYVCGFCTINSDYINPASEEFEGELERRRAIELSLADKLGVVQNIDYKDRIRVDVAGGEPLLDPQNLVVLEALAMKFGRENIGITSTGFHKNPNYGRLIKAVGGIDVTYDHSDPSYGLRPRGYSGNNLEFLRRVIQHASEMDLPIKTSAQVVLTNQNTSSSDIERIYYALKNAGVGKIFLMNLDESGRGVGMVERFGLSEEETLEVFETYQELSSASGGPQVVLQRRRDDPTRSLRDHPSLLISSQGQLYSHSWSRDREGNDDPQFLLGSLVHSRFSGLIGRNYAELSK